MSFLFLSILMVHQIRKKLPPHNKARCLYKVHVNIKINKTMRFLLQLVVSLPILSIGLQCASADVEEL